MLLHCPTTPRPCGYAPENDQLDNGSCIAYTEVGEVREICVQGRTVVEQGKGAIAEDAGGFVLLPHVHVRIDSCSCPYLLPHIHASINQRLLKQDSGGTARSQVQDCGSKI
ncbi:MAG: hypothetical protein JKY93_06600 [Gammaproteobacteria bacterium]|nr:hypothetical protein [Gammaproteobacteria bacterium]